MQHISSSKIFFFVSSASFFFLFPLNPMDVYMTEKFKGKGNVETSFILLLK